MEIAKKDLTIIIPAYNMENHLEKCLTSLIVNDEQMDQLEVLVINDGSKDRTSEIGHMFEQKYPGTFRVIDKANGHYGSCINRGLTEAKGVFVKVLDADDSFDPAVFPDFLRFLAKEDVRENGDAILSDYIQVDENLVLLSEHAYSSYANPVKIGDLTKEDRGRWFIHGLTYRTDYLRSINHKQTEGIAYTDIEWCFYPITQIKCICRFDGFLYRYTKLREDQSVNPTVQGRNIGMQVKVVNQMVERFPSMMKEDLHEENRKFLHDFINLQVSHIYQLFLLTLHRHIPSGNGLEDFDRHLLEKAPDLYNEVGSYTTRIAGIRFEPVRMWREHKRTEVKFMQWLYSLADFKAQVVIKCKLFHQ